MSSRTAKCGLLDLPPEIRDTIYEYVVIKDDSVITMLSNAHCFHSEVSAAQPAICWVNKQIRRESLEIFYKRNTFTAEVSFSDDLKTATNWVFALGDDKVALIRSVLLSSWTRRYNNSPEGFRYHVHAMVNPAEGTYALRASKYSSGGPEAQVKDSNELEKRFDTHLRYLSDGRKGTGSAHTLVHIMESFRKFVKLDCFDLDYGPKICQDPASIETLETVTIDD